MFKALKYGILISLWLVSAAALVLQKKKTNKKILPIKLPKQYKLKFSRAYTRREGVGVEEQLLAHPTKCAVPREQKCSRLTNNVFGLRF